MRRTAAVRRTVVEAIVVRRTGGAHRRATAANNEVTIVVRQRGALNALWLAACVPTIVLTLLVRLKVVGISLTAGIDKLLAVAGLRVEPPPIAVRTAVALVNKF